MQTQEIAIYRLVSLLMGLVLISTYIYGQVPNDFCDTAIELIVNDIPLTQNPIDATASSFPSSGINCGDGGTEDIWYKARVPSSGNITVLLEQFTFVDGIELYQGDCTNLTSYLCERSGSRPMSAEGLTADTYIYIRVVGGDGFNPFYDISVSDEGHVDDCTIDLVTIDNQSECDPTTNTFTVDLTVHYRTDDNSDQLRIDIGSLHIIDTQSSPQSISLQVPASGGTVDLSASIIGCNNYFLRDAIVKETNCFTEELPNDDCNSATTLEVNDNCAEFIGTNLGATFDTDIGANCPHIGDFPLRVWYNVVVPSSGRLAINVYESGAMDPVFHVFEGNCGNLSLLESCGGNAFRGQYYESLIPNDTLLISVTGSRGLLQGQFGICIIEPEPFTNDICDNAINLDNSLCDGSIYTTHLATESGLPEDGLSCDFPGNDIEDVWFTVTVPPSGNFEFETLEVERGDARIDFEVYSGSCSDLSSIVCEVNSTQTNPPGHFSVIINNQSPGDILFIRVGSINEVSFGLCLTEILPIPNDVCAGAIFLSDQNACQVFSNEMATASLNPTPGVTCDNTSPAIDTWFKTVMPAEGLLGISTNQVGGGLTNTIIEAYSGNCNSLMYLDCDSFSGPGNHALVALTDVPVGDTIYLRVLDFGSNDFGEFQLCQSFLGRSSCFIDSIGISDQVCNPTTNTFSQEVEVFYQTDGSADRLRARVPRISFNETYELTGSPMNIILDSLYAIGINLEFEFELFNNDGPNDCASFSNRVDTILAHPNCFGGVVANDDCANAIDLLINSFCEVEIYNNRGAHTSDFTFDPFSCEPTSENIPDVWFKFTQPYSDLIQLDIQFINTFPNIDFYSGTCEDLVLIGCGIDEVDLVSGESYYIRVFDRGFFIDQGEFGLCLTSYCPDEESVTQDLNGTFRFQNHTSISADNTIESGSEVIFDAGSFIEMTEGFEIETGAEFDALIDGCQDEICPIMNDKFTGFYKLSYIGDATGGFGIPFDTTESVELISFNPFNHLRSVELMQFPDFGGFLNVVQFDFDCENVVMFKSFAMAGCGQGAVSVVGAHIDGYNIDSPYDIDDDSEFIVNFIEFFDDGGCGFDPIVKTMKLTKVE